MAKIQKTKTKHPTVGEWLLKLWPICSIQKCAAISCDGRVTASDTSEKVLLGGKLTSKEEEAGKP